MKRKLGKFETAAAISGEHATWNIVGVLIIEGLPAVETIRQALDILQNRHPFLNVRLIKQGGNHFFESGEIASIPLNVVDRESNDHWVNVAEDGLNHKFDHLQGPLIRCDFLTDGQRKGEFILTAQHSIVDGASVENLLHELFDLCAKLESGIELEGIKTLQPLASVEEFFPSEFRGPSLRWKTAAYFLKQMGGEFKYQLDLRGKRKPPIDIDARGKIILIQTPKETSSLLAQRARKERVTLNSVVNAAVLLSVREHLYGGAHMPYRYMCMADLRPYVTPVPPVDQMGCYISPLRYTVQIHADDNLWSLASRITEQIYQSSKRGEKFLASVMAEQFLGMTFGLKRFRMATTAISYGGSSTRIRDSYGPFKVKALRGFVSNFGLGPEFSGRVTLNQDELCWDMLYLDSDMDQEGAELISKGIEKTLDQALRE